MDSRIGLHAYRFSLTTLRKFLEGSFEPHLISKHLTSFEDWGGHSGVLGRMQSGDGDSNVF